MKKDNKNKGFTLIEIVVAIAVLAIAITPILTSFITSAKLNVKSQKLMAATNIEQSIMEGFADNYYGVSDIAEAAAMADLDNVDEFDYLHTKKMYSLEQIASVTGLEHSVIRSLNPSLLRSCTPAREEFSVRLPAGTLTEELTEESLNEALAALGTPADAIVYTVKEGDTLWGISRRYSLSVKDICDANDIRE